MQYLSNKNNEIKINIQIKETVQSAKIANWAYIINADL